MILYCCIYINSARISCDPPSIVSYICNCVAIFLCSESPPTTEVVDEGKTISLQGNCFRGLGLEYENAQPRQTILKQILWAITLPLTNFSKSPHQQVNSFDKLFLTS